MKVTFKKLFACLMALTMVMTVTPFTAVTALADEAKSSNIAETEAKYKQAPSTTFTPKTGMSEVSWLNSSEVTTTDGATYKQSFAPSSNVLYWPSAYVGNTHNLSGDGDRLRFRTYYPSAVLLWDGTTDTYMPIMALAKNTNTILPDSGRTIFYAAPYDYERVNNATSPIHSADFYADEWRGVTGSSNENFTKSRFSDGSSFGFAADVLESFIYEGEGAGKCYNFGTNWENDAASFLHIDSGITFNSDGYLAKKLYWTTNSYSAADGFRTTKDNHSWQSSATVYVVNYKPIVDAAQEAANDLENIIQTEYTPEAINAYYDAVQALYDFDPNSYFDQNDGKSETDVEDIAARVGKCTSEISKLVKNYESAKDTVENSKQYRISFTDVDGNLLADHYYKANETIIQPSLDADKFVNTDAEGHYTVTYKWQPEVSATATADVDYVEKAVIPAKTPHTYSDYTPVYQSGKYAHTQKCTVSECGYVNWEYCTFVKDEANSVDATCTEDEILVKKCSVCGQSYTDTTNNEKKLNHNMQLVETIAPTCSDEGYSLYKCSRCDYTEKRDTVPAIEGSHDWQFTRTVAPTCNAEGYDLYTCTKCNSTKKDNIKPVDATNHSFVKTSTVAPTCTKGGYDLYTCERCGKTEHRNEVPAASSNHNFQFTKTVAPNCTEKGYDIYTCSYCNATEQRNVKPVDSSNHNYTVTVVAPTCTEKGYTKHTCTRCGDTYNDNYINASGHSFVNYVLDGNATCTEDGTMTAKCDRCDKTQTITAPNSKLGHDYSETVVPATCTQQGYTVYTCTRCNDTYVGNYTDAIGHSYNNVVTPATCTSGGYTTHSCVRGDSTYVDTETAPLGHSYAATVVAATTTSQGYTLYTCTRCGVSYTSDYTPVLEPTLTPSESKIANNYGVDAKTAQDINYILVINNVSSDTASLTESKMTANPPKGDGDYSGSNFGLLRAQTTKLKKNSVTVKWNKVKNADGYIVYGAKCGAKSKYKVLKVVSGKTTSYTHKKLKKGTYYKYNIVAFKYVNGVKVTLAASKKVHATTQGGKYGVAKSVKLNKSKATIKKGKTFKIKASEVKKDKTIKKHRNICYESSNTKIATVNSKGKIKAKKKGKCTIYVYAQNGVYKTVKVTVK